MWDDLFLPLSSRCRGRYPACFKTPSPPLDELEDQREGTAGYLAGARGGNLSCVLIYVWVFVNTGRIRIWKRIWSLSPLHIWYCALIMFWNEGIGHWDKKKEKTRLKVHKNYISKSDFIAPISHNIKTLKAKAFTHRMLISSYIYFDKKNFLSVDCAWVFSRRMWISCCGTAAFFISPDWGRFFRTFALETNALALSSQMRQTSENTRVTIKTFV